MTLDTEECGVRLSWAADRQHAQRCGGSTLDDDGSNPIGPNIKRGDHRPRGR